MTTQREAPLTTSEAAGGTIVLARRGGMAHIEICMPERLNAVSPDLGIELLSALRGAGADESIRAILLTGRGRAFCSGADLTSPSALDSAGNIDASKYLLEIFHPIIVAIREAPKPVVVAVQGACVGIGVSIALACDLMVMAQSAYLLLPFVRVGLGLDGGASALVTERVGLARAAELAMLGERLDADVARDWGLVNKVVADDELVATATDLAARLAEGPTVALSSIKQALAAAALPDFTRQLELEATLQKIVGVTADYDIGRLAFAEKRAPRFVGR